MSSPIVLNAQQEVVMAAAMAYMYSHHGKQDVADGLDAEVVKPFVLAGMAGTGKTTIMKTLLEHTPFEPKDIVLLAPTGKAAAVLNEKQDVVAARTVHSFVYGSPNDRLVGLNKQCDEIERKITVATDVRVVNELQQQRKALLSTIKATFNDSRRLTFAARSGTDMYEECRLIVVDEASMVSSEMYRDLLTARRPVIFVGDGNQLPPVGSNSPINFNRADAKLTDIVRQAAGSSVLNLSRFVLEHSRLPRPGEIQLGGDVVFSQHQNVLRFIEEGKPFPQFISYFHAQRHRANHVLRTHTAIKDKLDPLLNYLPFVGEQLMIDANIPDARLSRGDLVTITKITDPEFDTVPPEAHLMAHHDWYMIREVEFTDKYGTPHAVRANLNDLMVSMGHPKAYNNQKDTGPLSRAYFNIVRDTVPFMFPYAMTCHKAQGSEFNHVVLFNDRPRANYREFLYTGITRAARSITVAGHV